MLVYALVIFAIAAAGGMVLATHVLRGKFAPWALSMVHALLGAAGLILLIVMLVHGSATQQVLAAFVLFLVAALGGFFLASLHLRKKIAAQGGGGACRACGRRLSHAFERGGLIPCDIHCILHSYTFQSLAGRWP